MASTRKRVQKSKIRSALLAWYDDVRRDLPWRRDTDPYRVWISEIMLQQTRVEAVIPYYERWLARYPDIETLANADPEDLLKQWEGLGYYSRARNLHSAARVVHERFNSALPGSYDQLRELPGIGTYTAGAIASIAFGEARPAVDGNVRRVLSRIFDKPAPAASSVEREATALVDPERPGDFNQALMELGATVCVPVNPRCDECPVHSACIAFEHGTVSNRPGVSSQRKPLPHERWYSLIIWRGDHVLISKRPSSGLLANMWEFPLSATKPKKSLVVGEVTHIFTHKKITYTVLLCDENRDAAENERYVLATDLSNYPLPKAQRKIEALIKPRT
jgi:A/G-specific adenine glycosylase